MATRWCVRGWAAGQAATRLLPPERWTAFLVTPSTLLRWHRELVRHRWTYPRTGSTRGLDVGTVELVVRLAQENSRWGTG